ncbi:MAG: hypothetical protein D6767_04990 [Candidatus Hydrogenedentota bacterium]|nr:MAG: hypothetical protein D6767_04990 [Candidatus Hydrogenedentota bacterium]
MALVLHQQNRNKEAHTLLEKTISVVPDIQENYFLDGLILTSFARDKIKKNEKKYKDECIPKDAEKILLLAKNRFLYASTFRFYPSDLNKKALMNKNAIEKLLSMKKCPEKKNKAKKNNKRKGKKKNQENREKRENSKSMNNTLQNKPKLSRKEEEKIKRALKRIHKENKKARFYGSSQEGFRKPKRSGKGIPLIW